MLAIDCVRSALRSNMTVPLLSVTKKLLAEIGLADIAQDQNSTIKNKILFIFNNISDYMSSRNDGLLLGSKANPIDLISFSIILMFSL